MNLAESQIPPLRNSSWRSRYYGRNDKIEGVVTSVGMTKRTESLLRKEGQHRRCNNGILWDKASAIQLKGLLYLAIDKKRGLSFRLSGRQERTEESDVTSLERRELS